MAVTADHHHRQGGKLALHQLQDLDPVQLAALQPDVENDQRGLAAADRRERLRAVGRLAWLVAFVLQDAADEHPDIGLVVDDENVTRHAPAPDPC
jgi:hypothetical protein